MTRAWPYLVLAAATLALVYLSHDLSCHRVTRRSQEGYQRSCLVCR